MPHARRGLVFQLSVQPAAAARTQARDAPVSHYFDFGAQR
jgi:hypothetical protein